MGLGYLLTFGEGQADTPMVFVSIVMLTLVGGIAYLGVILAERRVLHYLPAQTTRQQRLVSVFWEVLGVPVGFEIGIDLAIDHKHARCPLGDPGLDRR